jgi:pteridine reductase
MQNNLTKTLQVALITGAARRIGAEIARTLHADGINIVLHCHTSLAEAEELCASLNKKRPQSAVTVRANLCDTLNLPELLRQAVNAWGRLDILVNNASRFYRTEMGKVTEFAWNDLMDNNVKAPLFLSQAAVPYLLSTQGCIVNIADVHADRPMRDYSAYCISKAGLVMMTKALAKELGPDIRVNAISPGPTIWPEKENTLTDEEKKKIIKNIPLRRIGNPQEIAKAVLYLSRYAEYVTGQVLAVDGGRSLRI